MRAAFLLSVFLTGAIANTCLENGMDYLPATIGRPGSDLFNLHVLECDTVFVRYGDTTTINTSTRLMFHKDIDPEKRTIIVDGSLIISGELNKNVIISGSITEGSLGMVPSPEPWNGFRVGPTGSLQVSHAVISNADTVIQSRTGRVSLIRTNFIRCNQIETPSRTITLDPRITTFHAEDFFESQHVAIPTQIDTHQEPSTSPPQHSGPEASSYRKYWLIGSGAALIATGAAITTVYLRSREDDPQPLIPLVPDLPPDGNGR
jgi:hypothetical protein